MFITGMLQGVRFAPDEPAGGSDGSGDGGDQIIEDATTESPADEPQDDGEPGQESAEGDETPEEGSETEEPETEGDGKAKAKGKPEKLIPLSAVIAMRKKNDQRIKALEQRVAKQEADKPKPPSKLQAYLASLPESNDETPEGRRAANHRELFPLIEEAKEHVFPELKRQEQAMGAALVAVDRLTFQVKELMKLIEPEKLPASLKHLDKLEQIQKTTIEESGEYMPYANAFDALQEQLELEAQEAAAKEEGIRTDERKKQDRERQATRAASGSGGPAPVTRVPRGPTSRRMTPAEIERRIQSGEQVGIA